MGFKTAVLNAVTPFTKWWGGLHMPFTRKHINGEDYYSALAKLQPGSILITRTRGEFSNLFIPGFFTHSGIYCPDATKAVDELVTEALGKGVVRGDLVTFITNKDYVMVLEPAFCGDKKCEVMKRAAEIAAGQVGKPYDYQYEWQEGHQRAFYCSELVWWAYAQACAELGVTPTFGPKQHWGEPTVKPQDFADADHAFTQVWVSRAYRPPGRGCCGGCCGCCDSSAASNAVKPITQ